MDSKITTETVALSDKTFTALRSVKNRLFVSCLDPANLGKSCVFELVGIDSATDGGTNLKVVTPTDANVRSAVHEYGGGSFLPISPKHEDDVKIIYTDYSSEHRLFVISVDGEDTADKAPLVSISTPPATRFADFCHDEKRCRILCVMEDHTDPHPDAVINSIVSISILDLYPKDHGANTGRANREMLVVAQGNDFYSTPVLSPNGNFVAFTTWNHPNMPWYTTTIGIQKLDEATGEPIKGQFLTVPSLSPSSVVEPRWWTDETLVYMSDETGWFNIYSWDIPTTLNNEPPSTPTCLFKKEAEFSGAYHG